MDKKEAAQILIESPDVDELEATREKYTLKPGTRVESRVWLEDQVQRGSLQFTPPPKLPMPGRIPVSAGGCVIPALKDCCFDIKYSLARRPYTDQDKKNLIVYLAKCYPKNEGRSGNTLYQTMVATVRNIMGLENNVDTTYIGRGVGSSSHLAVMAPPLYCSEGLLHTPG